MTEANDQPSQREALTRTAQPFAAADGYAAARETAVTREQRIHADVFNPAESDLDYFLRRKRELEKRHTDRGERPERITPGAHEKGKP